MLNNSETNSNIFEEIILREKTPKTLFKIPNTEQEFYGKDCESSCKLNEKGEDIFTSHLIQTTDYKKILFNYRWNNLGLRGPDPDYSANKKIMFLGGSFCIGSGVPVECSFPDILAKQLNANYLNLSDTDCLADFIDPITNFIEYNPDIVIVNDTRFIQVHGWVLREVYKRRGLEYTESYKKIFKKSDDQFLLMFESYLKNLFPKSKLILAHCVRRSFSNLPKFNHFDVVPFKRDDVIDLARDNCHPGIKSHKLFAEKIYNSII